MRNVPQERPDHLARHTWCYWHYFPSAIGTICDWYSVTVIDWFETPSFGYMQSVTNFSDRFGIQPDRSLPSAPASLTSAGVAPVVLVVPNDLSFLRLVRLVVASMAADAGYDFDEIEDLRTASDELVNLVMSSSRSNESIRVDVAFADLSLVFSASGGAKSADADMFLDPLGLYIVRALVETLDVSVRHERLEAGFRSAPPDRSHQELFA